MTAEVSATVTTSGNVAKMQSFGKHLADRATLDKDEIDGTEIAATMATNILGAKTLEEAFAADESSMPGGRDIVGVEQRIFGFDIRQGDDTEKSNDLIGGVFLIVHAMRLDNGAQLDWNTGATGIVAKLYKAEQLGAINTADGQGYIDCKIITKGNSNALSLVLLPKRVV